MKNTILFSVMSAAILSMSTAFAGGGSLFGGSGESSAMDNIYVGGSAGQAAFRCADEKGEEDECTNTGWKVFGGYKFTDNLAVEGGYYNLGEEEVSFNDEYVPTSYGDVLASGKSTGTSSGVGLTGIYSHEVIDKLEVFGKLGAMFWETEVETSATATAGSMTDTLTHTKTESGTSPLYGFGASYKVTDNVAVRGEWERYTAEYQNDVHDSSKTEESDVDILSAGLTFSTY